MDSESDGGNSDGNQLNAPTLVAPVDGATDQSTTVLLSWKNVDGASSYQLQVASTDAFSQTLMDSDIDSLSFKVGSLDLESTYFWRVRPMDDNNSGPWSEIWNFSTGSDPNPDPVQVTLVSPSDGAQDRSTTLNLEWNSVNNAVEYRVQLSENSNFSTSRLDSLVETTTMEISSLSNNSSYYWRVLPVLSSGTAEWSSAWTFETRSAPGSGGSANPDIWISAYLASWNHYAPPGGNWGNLPTDEIDWDAFTHLLYFNFLPRSDGTLSEVAAYENMNPDRINAIVSAAHENGKPVLYTVGGWDTRDAFLGAMSDQSRSTFINNLIAMMNEWGFDGIDLDMEPIRPSDTSLYIQFVNELHSALQNESTPLLDTPLLTTATNWQADMHAQLDEKFDQINLMTYDMSGAWQGWVTWHNSPLFNGGHTFPSTGGPLPSIEQDLNDFIQAGVDPSKLGLGIDFYGYVWNGVSEPLEGWESGNAPSVERPGGVPYYELAEDYNVDDALWDQDAKVSYLSISSPETFVSFDNQRSIKRKIEYLRNKGIGGAIIWEISGGYRQNQPAGERDLLLQSVKEELNN